GRLRADSDGDGGVGMVATRPACPADGLKRGAKF
ncbi:MAG: hypothetical protein SLRJCFUN_000867, partial [Candidatus Fervidibacter sp.]